MTDAPTDPVLLARDIAHDLGELTEHLSQAGPQQDAPIIETVLAGDEGILDRLTMLLATASHYTRAANHLHDISLDLDEHTSEIHLRDSRAESIPATPASAPAAPPTKTTSRPVRGRQS
jgi:hypothetical protein